MKQLVFITPFVLVMGLSGYSQESNSLLVPTPSFSNPKSSAQETTVPARGTKLQRNTRQTKVPAKTDPGLDPESDVDLQGSSAAKPSIISEIKNAADQKQAAKVAPRRPVSADEARVEMLEKIGDQLSLRMKSLREREDHLADREKVLFKREEDAAQRESMIRQIEESLILREDVVRRREKLPPPQAWRGKSAPRVYAKYAAVLDGETMQFYHTKNALEPTPVASTQKLLTALLVCDKGDLDGYVTIPRAATTVEPTVIGIRTGEKYTRRELLTALLVRSGNDIAAALALDHSGSIEAFADSMNLMAKRLGLVNSHFKNAHGLPAKGQHSCARDIAIIAFEAYQNPTIRELTAQRSFRFTFNGDRGSLVYSNTNKLLREMDDCNGMKTGFTYAAGRCLVSSVDRDGKDRISVVIKSNNVDVWKDSRSLLEWALSLEMLGPLNDDGELDAQPELVGAPPENRI